MNFNSESVSGLCDVNCVRLVRRVDANRVVEWVESGQLKFVFDIAPREEGKTLRALRFFCAEIFTPQFCARLTLREVIDKMLPPSRKFFASGEICQLLLVSRQTMTRIAREVGAVMHKRVFRIAREVFAAWLESRWLGGNA